MNLKKEIITNQYAQMYFTFSTREMNQIFSTINKNKSTKEKMGLDEYNEYIDESIKMYIEQLIEEEIYQNQLFPIGFRKYRYFMEPKLNNPLIVLTQFTTLPISDFKFDFPKKINIQTVKGKGLKKEIDEVISKILIENSYSKLVESEVVFENSEVHYDLCYVKDGFVIKRIEGQITNLSYDDDINKDAFIGAKVGDNIILDYDKVNIEANITKIFEEVPMILTDDIVVELNSFECTTVKDFKNKVKQVLEFSELVNNTLKVVLDYVSLAVDFEIDDYAIKHHQSVTSQKNDRTDIKKQLKHMIIYQYLIVYMAAIFEDDEPRNFDLIQDEFDLYELMDEIDSDEVEYESFIEKRTHEVRILEYCIDKGILDIDL